MDKIDKMDKMDRMDKMDKADKADKDRTNEKFRNFKLKSMDDRMRCIIFVVILAIISLHLQDQTLWNGLRHQVDIIFPGLGRFLPMKPPQYPKPDQKPGPKSDPLGQFTNGTTAFYMELSLAEIPAPGIVTQHVNRCIELATMLERCKEHKDVARVAASHLRDLSKLLHGAGKALRKMFVESTSIHSTFNIEVKAMIEKFESFSGRIFHDSDYFKIRMMKLQNTIGKFGKTVDESLKAILKAQSRREEVFGALVDFREVAKEYKVDTYRTQNFDLTAESIKEVKVTVGHLKDMADGLTNIQGKLEEYEFAMNNVEGNLNEISREALQHLKSAVEIWEGYHKKFIDKQELRVTQN